MRYNGPVAAILTAEVCYLLGLEADNPQSIAVVNQCRAVAALYEQRAAACAACAADVAARAASDDIDEDESEALQAVAAEWQRSADSAAAAARYYHKRADAIIL